MKIIDEEFLKTGQSKNGGWNKKQFEIIGINWPPEKGWKKTAIGKQISEIDALKFIHSE